MTKIAVLGGGQIGEALVSGLVNAGYDGADIVVTNRSEDRRAHMEKTYGVKTLSDNNAAVKDADFVFGCVKPYAIEEVFAEAEIPASAVAVSLAAGIQLEKLEAAAGDGVPVVRVMPNTPMLVGKGMSTATAGTHVSEEQFDGVVELLGAVGEVAVVAEKDIDAAAALAGSAPAYFFLVVEALVDAGVQLGLTRDVATKLATQTASGAGAMLVESGREPLALRAGVTSPGGTTAAAVRELEESGLRGAFYRAAEACAQRAKELG
ncbi:pyrroline-5-carboxylate reductase [uncultured Corynebacterium sp.]|uniref:pyrroline-5-carboxylate reductase n=1 Tax=uncultured Corynebacterium sp. TaxID=159447 RepID=UPI002889BE8A|nr:pyrroline-5-carboxylate reductase [uncultured Corynebacterium sp.]